MCNVKSECFLVNSAYIFHWFGMIMKINCLTFMRPFHIDSRSVHLIWNSFELMLVHMYTLSAIWNLDAFGPFCSHTSPHFVMIWYDQDHLNASHLSGLSTIYYTCRSQTIGLHPKLILLHTQAPLNSSSHMQFWKLSTFGLRCFTNLVSSLLSIASNLHDLFSSNVDLTIIQFGIQLNWCWSTCKPLLQFEKFTIHCLTFVRPSSSSKVDLSHIIHFGVCLNWCRSACKPHSTVLHAW